jgi:hypothetical protein
MIARRIRCPEPSPPRAVDPRTNETYVLLPIGEYERLKQQEYDDNPWSKDEIEALASEVGERAGWDEFDS